MLVKRPGFLLLDSLVSFVISILIIATLAITIGQERQTINHWESRVSSHKVMLLHLKGKPIPDTMIISGNKYQFSQNETGLKVMGQDGKSFEVKK
ncbi:hypothetical protein [Companilactobacillus mishanensis]|uniref:hypothetical protein n=1 Tax=Companilactobacillus mishanensis TaxID=2486008 RepID=UPI0012975644|nr:hypothetical protein [Companilactobacillus mishanensis]MQS88919.1 hypothetical protein [Companilactobacillus mishanensis]